jgi:hypothetical protein
MAVSWAYRWKSALKAGCRWAKPGNTGRQVKYSPTFHIGFGQPSEERVNELNQRLRDDGFEVKLPQRLHAGTFDSVGTGWV